MNSSPCPGSWAATASIFTAGALLPMSAAGIDPLAVLDGAVETAQAMDIRAFENPAWLYAAARAVLAGKGYGREFLCFFDHSLDALGRWWQQLTWQWQTGRSRALTPVTALLPGDLGVLDNLAASGQAQMLETLVHFAPIAKKVPVEMDWKDLRRPGLPLRAQLGGRGASPRRGAERNPQHGRRPSGGRGRRGSHRRKSGLPLLISWSSPPPSRPAWPGKSPSRPTAPRYSAAPWRSSGGKIRKFAPWDFGQN